MEVVLRKYGNGTVLAPPPSVLRERRHKLSDLIAQCDLGGSGCKTQGVALINKVRMLDLSARKARRVERVSPPVIEDAIGRLAALPE